MLYFSSIGERQTLPVNCQWKFMLSSHGFLAASMSFMVLIRKVEVRQLNLKSVEAEAIGYMLSS